MASKHSEFRDSAFRKRRFSHFLQLMQISSNDRILDVGDLAHTWEGSGLEHNVTILNLSVEGLHQRAPVRWEQGDACNMSMFEDQAFDVVFSNSVIEHVGELHRQEAMAREIRRVGKKYWIQTPNKHFPLEIHFRFPLLQYLPRGAQVVVAKTWPFSYSKQLGLDPVYELEHIWLLDRRHFESLFHDAKILTERFVGLPKSMIAAKAWGSGLTSK